MIFDWMSDPTAWLGLATLVILEIVLGIDNLVFIAILADKLPPHQRNRARMIGLTLAMVMRLGLLASIAWVVTLTQPLFTVLGAEISGRDLILILGGLFLLFKGTMELHERVEGGAGHDAGQKTQHAVFWQVILQIVVLDAVFSLDSVITAVGMVQDLSIMMIAVVVAMAVMMLASRPLMGFVARHPTVVILCLGLLLMIGFSLVAEGLGFHVPKGYLYAAIGFSILIELFNQLARRNRARGAHALSRRQRTARGGAAPAARGPRRPADAAGRRSGRAGRWRRRRAGLRARGKLDDRTRAGGRRARRALDHGAAWPHGVAGCGRLAADGGAQVRVGPFAPAAVRWRRGQRAGRAALQGRAAAVVQSGPIDLVELAREPLYVLETTPVLKVLDELRASRDHMLIVVDEHGDCEGLVTPMDVLTAVGGELPEHREDPREAVPLSDGSWLLEGGLAADRRPGCWIWMQPWRMRRTQRWRVACCASSAASRTPVKRSHGADGPSR